MQRSGQVLTTLTTPTPALYMESFSDAAKGKVKAAEREAGKKKQKEKEDKKIETMMNNRNEVLQQRLRQRAGLAGPMMPRPNAPARLQQRACAPLQRAGPRWALAAVRLRAAAARVRAVAEGRPAWALAAARLRAVAEGHQGHGAEGMGRTQGGAHFGGLRQVQRSQRALKWWPGRVLACFARRSRLNMALGFQHGQQQCQ